MKKILAHPNFEQSDYEYFKSKGYKNSEILAFWDRDLGMGKGPQPHKKAPGIVGFLSPLN